MEIESNRVRDPIYKNGQFKEIRQALSLGAGKKLGSRAKIEVPKAASALISILNNEPWLLSLSQVGYTLMGLAVAFNKKCNAFLQVLESHWKALWTRDLPPVSSSPYFESTEYSSSTFDSTDFVEDSLTSPPKTTEDSRQLPNLGINLASSPEESQFAAAESAVHQFHLQQLAIANPFDDCETETQELVDEITFESISQLELSLPSLDTYGDEVLNSSPPPLAAEAIEETFHEGSSILEQAFSGIEFSDNQPVLVEPSAWFASNTNNIPLHHDDTSSSNNRELILFENVSLPRHISSYSFEHSEISTETSDFQSSMHDNNNEDGVHVVAPFDEQSVEPQQLKRSLEEREVDYVQNLEDSEEEDEPYTNRAQRKTMLKSSFDTEIRLDIDRDFDDGFANRLIRSTLQRRRRRAKKNKPVKNTLDIKSLALKIKTTNLVDAFKTLSVAQKNQEREQGSSSISRAPLLLPPPADARINPDLNIASPNNNLSRIPPRKKTAKFYTDGVPSGICTSEGGLDDLSSSPPGEINNANYPITEPKDDYIRRNSSELSENSELSLYKSRPLAAGKDMNADEVASDKQLSFTEDFTEHWDMPMFLSLDNKHGAVEEAVHSVFEDALALFAAQQKDHTTTLLDAYRHMPRLPEFSHFEFGDFVHALVNSTGDKVDIFQKSPSQAVYIRPKEPYRTSSLKI